LKYRAEIDGLRAIAVFPVILFHAGFELFSGGFVGVDIFFVISGYLITTILIEDIENKRFNIVSFYKRRVRRILPALIFVLLTVYVVSYFIYLPIPHKVVGQYAVTSILSISNIFLYLKDNDYFGLDTSSNPLFHTWSLGIEEQFYLIFPIFLFSVWRFGKVKVFWIVCVITLLGILMSEWSWRNTPIANFYLLPTRAWELLAGSLVAFIVQKHGVKKNNTLAILGMFMIIFSIFVFDKRTPFPSVYALVPVLGVMLLIMFADRDTLVAKILSTKPFVTIGLISYSAYLWHLPIQVYFDYLFPGNKVASYYSYLFLAVISYVSYRFIEHPFRKEFSGVTTYSFIGLSSVVLIILGVIGHVNGGHPNRTEILSKLQHNNGLGIRCNGNTIVNDACATNFSPGFAVLGNSYAMTWVNSFKSIKKTGVVQLTKDSCAIGFIDIIKKDINSLPCEQFYNRAIQTILESDSIHTVILSSPFDIELISDAFIASLSSLLERLNSKKIIIIGPTPSAPFSVGECLFRKSLISTSLNCDFQVEDAHYAKVANLSNLLRNFDHVNFYDINDIICPNGKCIMNPEEGIMMYTDSGHLSVDGAKYVFKKMKLGLQ
tara:strand:- start:463 stop:2274 length:1812 start_codon:yes stop_codon:yes gene_type:complete